MVAQIAGRLSPAAQPQARRARRTARAGRLPTAQPRPTPAPLAPAAEVVADPATRTPRVDAVTPPETAFVLGSAAYAGFRAAYAVLAERIHAGRRPADLVAEVDRARHLMWLIVDGSEHRSAERLMRRLIRDA